MNNSWVRGNGNIFPRIFVIVGWTMCPANTVDDFIWHMKQLEQYGFM